MTDLVPRTRPLGGGGPSSPASKHPIVRFLVQLAGVVLLAVFLGPGFVAGWLAPKVGIQFSGGLDSPASFAVHLAGFVLVGGILVALVAYAGHRRSSGGSRRFRRGAR